MSKYDDEGDEAKRKEDLKRRDEEIIRQSTFWSDLRQQIEKELEKINSHSHWKEKLGGLPLFTEDASNLRGYQIRKLNPPSMDIRIRHMGSHIMISRVFYGQPLGGYKVDERLDFAVIQESVLLRTADTRKDLGGPEASALYLLEPFIELLKNS